ncbi:SusC/RagA family TonB-linked outer membrane protein [Olivibacter domesticus]|uniref:TonB-linked outer membrane protein, SusC/RagA family n=1 Tax=Olivibacter domesticus TaxID=407022 RepID=A0A1H7SGR8_OLID1|nr:TonB-dependent receptor [Olivibacter domesticus]SEL71683.1 TonB-linked outer membrane protein, SusC/RagA family [Olivibacter domesticus]
MKRKKTYSTALLWLLVVLLLHGKGYSQVQNKRDEPIHGVVMDADSKEPLKGATVLFLRSSVVTQTDENGRFQLSPPEGNNVVLVARSMGYLQKEVHITNQQTLQIALKKDQVMLDEVVAIGYATVSRKDLTGSVSSLNDKQLKDIPINSAAEALTGRLAGVQVTTSEGSPGANVQLKIRGGGSITQDNSPLYIIDGIQVEDGLNSLSPQDIASIDVLKDASSTAIYGARGANGVVIITTKGGKEMKPEIGYSNIFGLKQLANKLELMHPYDFVVRQYERTRGNTSMEEGFAAMYGQWDELEKYKNEPFVDWQKKTFGNDAFMQTHNLSITGGTEAVQYNLSLTSNDDEGIMLNSDFNRKMLNFRFDNKISSKLKVGFNVRYNNQTINGAGSSDEAGSTYNMLRHTIKYRPLNIGGLSEEELDEAYYEETNTGNALGIINPVQLSDAQYRNRHTRVTNLNGYANYVFNNWLSFRSSAGFNYQNDDINSFDDGITSKARTLGARLPMVSLLGTERNSFNNSNVLTFKIQREQHHIDAIVGNEFYTISSKRTENQLRYFPEGIGAEKALAQLSLGTVIPTYPQTYNSETRTVSFFNRTNYAFADKYLASFSIRADASSRFASDKRWGFFPSGSIAWRLSAEPFLKDVSAISDMKLRASYGSAGNDRIDDYLFLNIFGIGSKYALNEQILPGLAVNDLANRDLIWETTVSKNIGLDLALFNSRIQLTVDAYHNKVNDLLLNVPIPTTSGYKTQLQNIGNTSNKGIEFQLNATAISNKNFTWNTAFNLSFNRNRIDKLSNSQSYYYEYSGFGISGQPADYVVQVGQSVGTMYGFVSDGFYSVNDFNYDPETSIYTLKEGVVDVSNAIGTAQPGWMKLKDLDGNNRIDENDKTIIGDATPKFAGGLYQQFTYKNFDMSIFLNFVYGNKIYNANKIEFTNGYSSNSNSLAIMNDRWKTIDGNGQVVQQVVTEGGSQVVKGIAPDALAALNQNASIWMPISGVGAWYPTSWAMEDGSFLRINNVTFGYSFPSAMLHKIRLKKLRIYGTVNNLAVFTNYSGYDPEVNTRRAVPTTPGVDYSAYPRSKTFIIGLNLTL